MTIAIRGALQTGTSTAGANISVDLTAITGLAQGDVVVVFTALTTASMGTFDPIITSANWNDCGIGRLLNSDSLRAIRCYYKVMGASPDTTVAINGTGTAGDSTGAIAIAFSGVNPDNPLDATALSSTGATTADLVSITPAHKGALVIGAAVGAYDTSKSTITNYTLGARDTNATRGQSIGLAYRIRAANTGGAEDPPAWASNWGAGNWASIVLALNSTLKFATPPNLTTGSPVLGTPACTLTVFAPAPNNYDAGAPVADAIPVFAKTAGMPVCVATPLTVGSPVLGSLNLVSPVATALTVASPVPAPATILQSHVLVAPNLTVASPALAAPSALSTVAVGMAVGSPTFGINWGAATGNYITNNTMQGAVVGLVGSGGAIPKDWGFFYEGDDLDFHASYTVNTIGVDAGTGASFLEFTLGNKTNGFEFDLSFSDIDAAAGAENLTDLIIGLPPTPDQTVVGSFWYQVTNDDAAVTDITVELYVYNNTGTVIGSNSHSLYATRASWTRYEISATPPGVGVYYEFYIRPHNPSSTITNFKQKIGSPQFEVGGTASAIINTYGVSKLNQTHLLVAAPLTVASPDFTLPAAAAEIAAVTLDAEGVPVLDSGTSLYLPTLTIPATNNRELVLLIHFHHITTPPTALSFVWDSAGTPQPLQLIDSYSGSSNGVTTLQIWGLTNPTSGNKVLTGTWTGSSFFVAKAIALKNVRQGGGFGTPVHGSGSGDTTAITVSSAASKMVLALHSMYDGGGGASSFDTLSGSVLDNTSIVNSIVGFDYAPGAASVTLNAFKSGVSQAWLTQGISVEYNVVGAIYPANLTVGSPSLGIPNVVSPIAIGFAVGSPTFGTPNVVNPVAVGFAIGSPVLGTTKVVSPVAIGFAIGSPTIGAQVITQKQVLSAANSVTASPLISAGELFKSGEIGALSLTVGLPAIGSLALKQVHKLVAPNLTTSAPTFGVATVLGVGATSAVNLTVGSPVIPGLTIKQVHVIPIVPLTVKSPRFSALVGGFILDQSRLDGPDRLGDVAVVLGQRDTLVAANLTIGSPTLGVGITVSTHAINLTTGAPTFGAATVAQKHVLATANLTVGQPTFTHPGMAPPAALTAPNYAAGSPAVDATPRVGKTAIANGIAVGSPVIAVGALHQNQVLPAAANLEVSGPTFSAINIPSLGIGNLIIGAPTIGSSVIAQRHTLVTGGLTVASPVVGLPFNVTAPSVPLDLTVLEVYPLAPATNLTVGSPAVAVATLRQAHALVGVNNTVGSPVLAAAALSHTIPTAGLTVASPAMGAPALVKTLAAAGITVASPSLTSPLLTKVVAATNLTVASPSLDAAKLGHNLIAVNLSVGLPTLATPNVVNPVGIGLTVGALSIAEPYIVPAGFSVLLPEDKTVGSPVIGASALRQDHQLAADDLAAQPPEIDTPGLIKTLTAANLAVSTLNIGAGYAGQRLDATGFVIGSPIFGVGILGIRAQGLTTLAPTIGASTLRQSHTLATVGIAPSAVNIGTPAMAVRVPIDAVDLTVASPTFGLGEFIQNHRNLIAVGLTVFRPTIATPTMVVTGHAEPVSIDVGSPTFGVPGMVCAGSFSAVPLVVGRPTIDTAQQVQIHALYATSVALVRPTVGRSSMGAISHTEAAPVETASPKVGIGTLTILLAAEGLTVGRPEIARAEIHEINHFVGRPLVVGRPVISEAQYTPWGGYHITEYDAYLITVEYDAYYMPNEAEVYPQGLAA